jgi:glycosyltransferase involved in cell wall biosynthesis
LDELAERCGVITHGVSMERQPSPLKDLASLGKLVALMRRLRPHIVHAHTPKAGMLGMLAARLAGVAVRLYSVHGLPLLTRTGKLRTILESAEKLSAWLSTKTYAVSPSLRDLMLELKLCPADKVGVPGDGSCSGIDTEFFRAVPNDPRRAQVRSELGIPQDAVVGVFVGRLAKDKGIAVLADAWPAVSAQVPNLHLILGGELDETDPVPADKLAVLQNDPRVRCLGYVEKSTVPGLFAAADFGLLPTFREGLGQVALECGAMGKPMLSTDVPGVVSAVQNGLTGILVPAGQVRPLAEAMLQLATDAALRAQLGQAAEEFVRARFSEHRVNALWMEEYRRLVQESMPGFTMPAIRAEGHS